MAPGVLCEYLSWSISPGMIFEAVSPPDWSAIPHTPTEDARRCNAIQMMPNFWRKAIVCNKSPEWTRGSHPNKIAIKED